MDWKILTTRGRISRTHFAVYAAALWGASFLMDGLAAAVTTSPFSRVGVSLLLSIPIWWSTYCICVRRAHDIGHSAWFVVLSSLAQVLGILLMGMAVLAGLSGYSTGMVGWLFGGGALLTVGSLMVMAMLLLTGPDHDNRWGLDPR